MPGTKTEHKILGIHVCIESSTSKIWTMYSLIQAKTSACWLAEKECRKLIKRSALKIAFILYLLTSTCTCNQMIFLIKFAIITLINFSLQIALILQAIALFSAFQPLFQTAFKITCTYQKWKQHKYLDVGPHYFPVKWIWDPGKRVHKKYFPT